MELEGVVHNGVIIPDDPRFRWKNQDHSARVRELADALSVPEARATVVAFLEAVRADQMFHVVGYDQEVYQAGFEYSPLARTRPAP